MMSKIRKTQSIKRGTRTGVETNLEFEDGTIEEWIDSSRSPRRDGDKEDGVDDSDRQKSSPSNQKVTATRRRVKTPKKLRLELPGGRGQHTEDSDENDVYQEGVVSVQALSYARKVRRNIAAGNFELTSPSELSRVSTAPPSPKETTELHPNDDAVEEQEVENFPFPDDARDHSDIEDAFSTQENSESQAFTAQQDDITHQAAATKAGMERSSYEVHDDSFGGGGNDDESEEGDPLAPPTADDSSEDENQVPQTEGSATKKAVAESEDYHDKHHDDDDHDDDDHDEGPNYNLVHDPETPNAVRAARAKKEKSKLERMKKKRKRKSGSDTEASQHSTATPNPKKGNRLKNDKKYRVAFSPRGIPIANRDYQMIPIAAFVEKSPEEGGPRRSRRPRVKPLEFWRGEKMQFGAHEEDGDLGEALGDMPVVKEVQKANPTPYRKRKMQEKFTGGAKKKKSDARPKAATEEEFDSRKLRRKYMDGEEAYLWDDSNEDTVDQKVVSYGSKMEGSKLPLSKHRTKSEGKVTGRAAQAFNVQSNDDDNYVGYIMGNLVLPPRGIKDHESVGPCAQTFTVCSGQPKALEVAYGDPDITANELDPNSAQRFLLSPGDMFRVPPGNSYRLENHSISTDCLLTWTIIRPKSIPTEE